MKHTFFAGSSKTDITPPLGTLINGDFVTHYARYIHDKLYSKALVLKNSEITIAIVIVDICAMDKNFLDKVKMQIEKNTGIQSTNILIAATHTHYAGSVVDLLVGAADLTYRKKLGNLIVQSVGNALENCRQAKIGFVSADAPEHVVCRRYYMKQGYKARNPVTGGYDVIKTNPVGDEDYIEKRSTTVDSGLSILAVKGTDEKWISVVGNYSMHYVGDCDNGTITSDYFGVFSSQIEKLLDTNDSFVGMMTNGTSGEANIWDFLQPRRYPSEPFRKSELIGNDLAEKAFTALQKIQWNSDPHLASMYELAEVSVRKPTAQELEIAKQIVASADYENLIVNHEGYEGLVKVYAREQVLLNEYPDTISFPVQALKIGEGIIGALGGEFFSETGLALKKNAPDSPYFTICMANGYAGYVPPAHEIEKGGYETWRCRTSHLKPESENILRNKLSGMISSLSHTATRSRF